MSPLFKTVAETRLLGLLLLLAETDKFRGAWPAWRSKRNEVSNGEVVKCMIFSSCGDFFYGRIGDHQTGQRRRKMDDNRVALDGAITKESIIRSFNRSVEHKSLRPSARVRRQTQTFPNGDRRSIVPFGLCFGGRTNARTEDGAAKRSLQVRIRASVIVGTSIPLVSHVLGLPVPTPHSHRRGGKSAAGQGRDSPTAAPRLLLLLLLLLRVFI